MSGQTKIRTATIRNSLLAGVAAVALSAAAPDAPRAQNGSFFGGVEGRYLMSFGDESTLGVGSIACDIYPIDCDLETAASETDDGVGGKVRLGFRSSGAWDVAIAGSGGRLDGDEDRVFFDGSCATGCGVPYSAEVYGQAESETQYGVADFEVGYNVGIGNNGGNVRLFVGARYARFDQDVFFTGIGFPGVPFSDFTVSATTQREVEFEGVGPRIGLGLNLPLGSRVSIAAEASGSVLFGDRDTTDDYTVCFPGAGPGACLPPLSLSDSDDMIIPNAEGNVGLSFVVAGSHPGPVAEITFGYHAEAWFDINNTQWDLLGSAVSILADPSVNPVEEEDGDQYIHGPFLRIGIRR